MVVAPCLYSGFPKELPKAASGEIQKIVQYTIVKNSESQVLVYIYFTLIVGVKIVGRPDLADWKTKICLIIVLKQVEEKASLYFPPHNPCFACHLWYVQRPWGLQLLHYER